MIDPVSPAYHAPGSDLLLDAKLRARALQGENIPCIFHHIYFEVLLPGCRHRLPRGPQEERLLLLPRRDRCPYPSGRGGLGSEGP